MSCRSTGAPVVTTDALSNSSRLVASLVASAPAPSSSIEALPTRRVTSWAWVSSGKNDRRARRISPSLSRSRKSTNSGLSRLRSSGGMALMRSRVATASAWRAARPSSLGSSVVARRRAPPATLWVTSPLSLATRASLKSMTSTGVMTVSTDSFARSCSATSSNFPRFSSVKSSSMVWPSSMVTRVSMAWPPKRSW